MGYDMLRTAGVWLTKSNDSKAYRGAVNISEASGRNVQSSKCNVLFDEVSDMSIVDCVKSKLTNHSIESKVFEAGAHNLKEIKGFVDTFIAQVSTNVYSAIVTGKLRSGNDHTGRADNLRYNAQLECNADGVDKLTYHSMIDLSVTSGSDLVYGSLEVSSEDDGNLAGIPTIACGLLAARELADMFHADMSPVMVAFQNLITL